MISGIDLRHEYEVAAPAAGLTLEEIKLAQRHALDIAFLTREEKGVLFFQQGEAPLKADKCPYVFAESACGTARLTYLSSLMKYFLL